MNKKVIIESLKAWYIIDSILLNEHARTYFKKNKDFQEYVTIKAGLVNTLCEFYKHIGYTPKSSYSNDKFLQESAVVSARNAKALSANMLQKPAFKTYMKNYIIKESVNKKVKDIKTFQKNIISERFLRMSLDNALIGIPLIESKSNVEKENFSRSIIEESYRILRTALIHMVKSFQKN